MQQKDIAACTIGRIDGTRDRMGEPGSELRECRSWIMTGILQRVTLTISGVWAIGLAERPDEIRNSSCFTGGELMNRRHSVSTTTGWTEAPAPTTDVAFTAVELDLPIELNDWRMSLVIYFPVPAVGAMFLNLLV